jgi:1,4-dihydroxy-2-naphthoyl-CoA hydrolase
MSPHDRISELEAAAPFARMLGMELLEADPELVRARLRWRPELCTVGGAMHGGALMALADNCGGLCAMLNLPEGAQSTATITSSTNLMRSVRTGEVTATARPLHKGRTLMVIETEIRRQDGALAAKVAQTQVFGYGR